MKRSQLNPKPIKLTPIEACAFIGKAIKEYRQNNPKRWKQCKYLNDPKDKDVTGDEVIERYERFKKKARKNGSSTEGRVSDTSERAGKRRRRSSSNETDTTISTAA